MCIRGTWLPWENCTCKAGSEREAPLQSLGVEPFTVLQPQLEIPAAVTGFLQEGKWLHLPAQEGECADMEKTWLCNLGAVLGLWLHYKHARWGEANQWISLCLGFPSGLWEWWYSWFFPRRCVLESIGCKVPCDESYLYPAQHSASQVCCRSCNLNSNSHSHAVLWFFTTLSYYMKVTKARWVVKFSCPHSRAAAGVPSQTDHVRNQYILPQLQTWVSARGRAGSLPGCVFPALTGFLLFGGRDRQLPPALIVLTWKHRNPRPGSEQGAVSPNILLLTVASSGSSGKYESIRAV